jgi:ankyrin repeat protein
MPFLSLPNELLLQIAHDVLNDPDWTEPAINSLARANKRLYNLLNDLLYQNNIQSRGSIALLWAVRRGRERTVRRLLHLGANVNMTIEGHAHFRNAHNYTQTQPYETPLHAAVRQGNHAIVRLLLDSGAAAALHTGGYTDWTPLFAAIDWQKEEIAREVYIAMGAVPLGELPTIGGLTPLHSACRFDMPNLVRLFLEMSADVDLMDGKARTPLYHALYFNKIRVVHLLLDYGADSNVEAGAREACGCKGQSSRLLFRRYVAENPYDDRVRKVLSRVSR